MGPSNANNDFEETLILFEGDMEATFRGRKSAARAGDTLNIPANAPHQFHNASTRLVRMFCICSNAGQEKLFMEVGVPVATRTTPPRGVVGWNPRLQGDVTAHRRLLKPVLAHVISSCARLKNYHASSHHI
jgi:uncharacterized cupin superfamily protein